MEVKELTTSAAEWDAYVRQHPGACNYHQSGWKAVVEEGFRHTTRYLYAGDGGKIVGILPLVSMKSFLFGHFLVSLPFFNYGGILADNKAAEIVLLGEARRIAQEQHVDHIELRHLLPVGCGLRTKTHKVTMILQLQADVDAQWKKFDAKLRNQIRKAEKSDVVVQIGSQELVKEFYKVFAVNMRDLGTPVYSPELFQSIWRHFPKTTRIFLVSHKGQSIAAGLGTFFRDTIEVPWAGSMKAYRHLCPNMLLYWEAIKFAIQHGLTKFDFGRSTPGEGTYRFKEQWGASGVPLTWEYWTANSDALPDISPRNAKYELAIRMWKKLPLQVANHLGPIIVRNIP
jgi:serine/alanine adding enzyme